MSAVEAKKTEGAALAVVATTGHLLLVDLYTKKVVPLENERPEYYGVSWFPGGKSLVLSHSATDNAQMKDIVAYASSEVGYLSQGKAVTEAFLSAPHQILCASDGRVICTNTGRNAITVIDIDKPGFFQEKKLSTARWDRLSLEGATGDHLNSVYEKNGLLYVIAHGHNKGSLLATLGYPDLEMVSLEPIEGRTGLHNIWVTDEGQKIACHSNVGALIDLDSNKVIWEAGSPIYTRGLAASADFVLVGESQMTGRDLRRSSLSGLWVLESGTFKTLDYICLGPYGAVNEVRLLNVSDLAHHGHLFPHLPDLLKQNISTRTTDLRMAGARKATQDIHAWSGYELVYGVPHQLGNGKKQAGENTLCLMRKNAAFNQIERELDFSYSLNSESGVSHVSVVTYQGSGADTDMHALLVQAVSECEAGLSLWTHDGTTWALQQGFELGGLPLSGNIRVVANSEGLEFYLNKCLLMNVPADQLPLLDGVLGIRWLDSIVSRGDDGCDRG